MKNQETGFSIVRVWHDALDSRDLDRFVATMHHDVEFIGPRGSGRGVEEVRDWARTSGIHLEHERWFGVNDEVLVSQLARWLEPDTGKFGPSASIASVFQVHAGLIARIVRFDTWDEALQSVNTGGSESRESMPLQSGFEAADPVE